MDLDKVLAITQRSSLVAFMIANLFIIVSEDILKYVMMSALSLYIFIGVSYVNHARKNGVNESQITKQVAEIVLGTVILIIAITLMFKFVNAMKIF